VGNKLFRERLEACVETALREAQDCASLKHPAIVGRIRQIVVERLLTPLLPEGIHIGTGQITDSSGRLSAETDVIIYDRRTVPPIFYDAKQGLFPIESVYYAIEVKSEITAGELRGSIENGQRLKELKGAQPISALFAFKSDLKEAKDSKRLIDAQKDLPAIGAPPISVFCIAGKEYGFYGNDRRWSLTPDGSKHLTTLSFLIGVLNTLVAGRREPPNNISPGWYYFPEIEGPK
jgi:hypothetical protein